MDGVNLVNFNRQVNDILNKIQGNSRIPSGTLLERITQADPRAVNGKIQGKKFNSPIDMGEINARNCNTLLSCMVQMCAGNPPKFLKSDGDESQQARALIAFLKCPQDLRDNIIKNGKLGEFLQKAADATDEEINNPGYFQQLLQNYTPHATPVKTDITVKTDTPAKTDTTVKTDTTGTTNALGAITNTTDNKPTVEPWEGIWCDITTLRDEDVNQALTHIRKVCNLDRKAIEKLINDLISDCSPETGERAIKFIAGMVKSMQNTTPPGKAQNILNNFNGLKQVINIAIITSTISNGNTVQAHCKPPEKDNILKNYTEQLSNTPFKENRTALQGLSYAHMIFHHANGLNENEKQQMIGTINEVLAVYGQNKTFQVPNNPLAFTAELLANIRAKQKELFAKIDLPNLNILQEETSIPFKKAVEEKTTQPPKKTLEESIKPETPPPPLPPSETPPKSKPASIEDFFQRGDFKGIKDINTP